ncbi:MAG TPA: proline--tRNA ligase [Rhodospirillaceae bacterium]|nr:proline--tRNA ligase [Rhodospirillaceae bacterium]
MTPNAITPTRAQDFPEWYQQVIRAADLAESSPVRGCMTIKPNGYAIWEGLQAAFDREIKAMGVRNAYFPLLIPLSYFSREAQHVDGFAKECAVVTHHRLEAGPDGGLQPAAPLEEPLVVRPTSEMIIGDAMARWVQSYRDLPLKLNQWANVMRWEMRPRLFLRTSEFLWQEGHNAFATADEADADARAVLDMYVRVAREVLALPSIPGRKTEDETFPGAEVTYTFEMMMQDGKALQSGTSHHMGQNFARSCGIKYQDKDGREQYAHTTSWGVSSRLIGALIMTHADDDGLVLPPRIAPEQVAILPITKSPDAALTEHCQALAEQLRAAGIRAEVDARDMRTPDKIWGALKRGVPLRVEIGGREAAAGAVTHVRRDLGRGSKATAPVQHFLGAARGLLDEVQQNLLARAEQRLRENTHDTEDLDGFFAHGTGFARAPASVLQDPSFTEVKKRHGVTPRCMPFADGGESVIIARAY